MFGKIGFNFPSGQTSNVKSKELPTETLKATLVILDTTRQEKILVVSVYLYGSFPKSLSLEPTGCVVTVAFITANLGFIMTSQELILFTFKNSR